MTLILPRRKNRIYKWFADKNEYGFSELRSFPHRTILENTEYGLEIRGMSKEQRIEKAEQALQNAGLLVYKDQYPRQLSGECSSRLD